jgi:hypothetical protein
MLQNKLILTLGIFRWVQNSEYRKRQLNLIYITYTTIQTHRKLLPKTAVSAIQASSVRLWQQIILCAVCLLTQEYIFHRLLHRMKHHCSFDWLLVYVCKLHQSCCVRCPLSDILVESLIVGETIEHLRGSSDRNVEELPGTPLQGNYSKE